MPIDAKTKAPESLFSPISSPANAVDVTYMTEPPQPNRIAAPYAESLLDVLCRKNQAEEQITREAAKQYVHWNEKSVTVNSFC